LRLAAYYCINTQYAEKTPIFQLLRRSRPMNEFVLAADILTWFLVATCLAAGHG
jgi:hypothetical protein